MQDEPHAYAHLAMSSHDQGHEMSNVVPVKVLQLKTINDTMFCNEMRKLHFPYGKAWRVGIVPSDTRRAQ
jgi:hypothetical protein